MISNHFTASSVIRQNESLMSSNLGDDFVMMDVDRGTYYGLEAVAARIWSLAQQPVSVDSLCCQLSEEYDISPDVCRQEVLAFLRELLDHKIMQSNVDGQFEMAASSAPESRDHKKAWTSPLLRSLPVIPGTQSGFNIFTTEDPIFRTS